MPGIALREAPVDPILAPTAVAPEKQSWAALTAGRAPVSLTELFALVRHDGAKSPVWDLAAVYSPNIIVQVDSLVKNFFGAGGRVCPDSIAPTRCCQDSS